MFTSLPGGVRRVADGEQRRELLDEGVALQLALVVFQALENDTMVSGVERRLREDVPKYRVTVQVVSNLMFTPKKG